MNVEELLRALRSGRFDLSTEAGAQADIETHLVQALGREAVVREVKLSARDRPDFLIAGQHVVEVKLRGAQKRAVFDQLTRYAKHDCVETIILVSNLSMGLPQVIWKKPAYFVPMGRAWL